MKKYLALDIGGSAIKYALVDEEVKLTCKGKVKTPRDTIENFVEVVGKIYDIFADEIEGIAISMPGVIDSKKGFAFHGGSLGYIEDCNVIETLQKRCPIKIHLENDGKCAALGEFWKGSLKGCNDGVVMVLGTGIGGGIISNGKLVKGNHFAAGEFSFIRTNSEDTSGYNNFFGFQNGVNSLISGVATKKNLQARELDGIKVFEMVNDGDEDVLEVLDMYCEGIALQILNLQNILDPEKVAIGGGISEQPLLIKYIIDNVKKIHNSSPMNNAYPNVVLCDFNNDANIIGAIYNYRINEEIVI